MSLFSFFKVLTCVFMGSDLYIAAIFSSDEVSISSEAAEPPIGSSEAGEKKKTEEDSEAKDDAKSPPDEPQRNTRNRAPRNNLNSMDRWDAEFRKLKLQPEQLEKETALIAAAKNTIEKLKVVKAEEKSDPVGEMRILDRLRMDMEALLDDAQKKEFRTALASPHDPGAANGGPITTLREQLRSLQLSEEQERKVQDLVFELRREIGEAARPKSVEPAPEANTKSRGSVIRDITEKYRARILEVLTPEQRTAFDKLSDASGRKREKGPRSGR